MWNCTHSRHVSIKNPTFIILLPLLFVATAAVAQPGPIGDFQVKSADGRNELSLRGLLHVDSRTVIADAERKAVDTLLVRRLRPILSGKISDVFSFYIMTDFGGATVALLDAWVEARLADGLRLRVGKLKTPFGLERLQSAAALSFIERAYPTQLAPNRDIGLQVHGEVLDDRLGYAVGVFNGTPDGASVDGDHSDSKDLAGRIYLTPFVDSDRAWLRGLLVGAAYSTGEQDGTAAAPALASFRSPGQQVFYAVRKEKAATVSGAASEPVVADGWRQRWAVHGRWYAGPFGLFAEFGSNDAEVRRGSSRGTWRSSAWQGAATWVWGGKPSFEGVRPEQPFALGSSGWGALELAVRASGIEFSKNSADVWADPAAAARRATSVTGGAHWHLATRVRLFADYEQTAFEGGAGTGDRPVEHVVLGRVQVTF